MVGVFFIVGLVAAAYSSADSALTALTTSFTVDILDGRRMEERQLTRTRQWVHMGVSVVLGIVIMLFRAIQDENVISAIFRVAGYTSALSWDFMLLASSPAGGRRDRLVPLLAILSPLLSFLLNRYSAELFMGYKFGFELLIVNGAIMFAALLLTSRRPR